ncbi:MAG: deoxyribodipyrimidine photo-lyase [Myxococcota bacterium]
MRGIHWFRNDLRLLDNTCISALAEVVEEWLPVFVLDPELLGQGGAKTPRAHFLLDCVARLEADLDQRGIPLQVLKGKPEKVIPALVRETKAERLSFSQASTPLALRRDHRVADAVEKTGASTLVLRDHTIFGPEEIRTKTGGAYSVYTPYRNTWWNAWKQAPRLAATRVRLPKKVIPGFEKKNRLGDLEIKRGKMDRDLPQGGEAAAKRRLRAFLDGPVGNYAVDRDRPDVDGTSRLSPYLRFGAISVRKCIGDALAATEENPGFELGASKWMDELVWREFYTGVLENSPRVLTQNFRPEYDALEWNEDPAIFEAWCEGRTGFPFIDAGMRQLRETGWMHNRVRMVVASFLTKDLLVDWRKGERFFFDALVDGDPASNNGGWQWAASTGTDAQPYFRIFNPTTQGEKWDPEGRYVRKWVPELRAIEGKAVHTPGQKRVERPADYPAPIVDHAAAREAALAAFKKARQLSDRHP